MTIDHVDRTGRTVAAGQETERMDSRPISRTRPATVFARSLVAVALAALAILVILPAALAAQGASAI